MTHKKIAKMAGVSTSTVSKALSGSKEISSTVRDKVIKIALESNYFEQKTKRKLAYTKGKAITVGIICPEIISIYYSRIINYMKNEIESLGGQVVIYINDFSNEKQNAILENITLKNAVDGIIFFSFYETDTTPTVPSVFLCNTSNSNFDSVICDSDKMLLSAVEHLSSLGHRTIGYVGEPLTTTTYNNYRTALEKTNLSYDERFVYTISKRFEDIGADAAAAMIDKNEFPDAIICAYDEIALSLIHKFLKNGIRVPDDVSVMGINDIPYSSYSEVPLTTIKHYTKEQCTLAVQLLYEKMLGKRDGGRQLTINHEIIIRNSTKRKEIYEK